MSKIQSHFFGSNLAPSIRVNQILSCRANGTLGLIFEQCKIYKNLSISMHMKFYFVNCLSVGSCIFCVKKKAFLCEENAFTKTKEITLRLSRIGIT